MESFECIHLGIQGTGPHPAIQGHSQIGRIPGHWFLTVVLTSGGSDISRLPQGWYRGSVSIHNSSGVAIALFSWTTVGTVSNERVAGQIYAPPQFVDM